MLTILARTLNSRGNEFTNISENLVLVNISESTVLYIYIYTKIMHLSVYETNLLLF